MSDDYNETYWRNRGGEGPSPWNSIEPPVETEEDILDKLMKYSNSIPEDSPSALDVQVGGGHYKDFEIQPIEYIQKNALGFIEGSIVKYITRYEEKGGANDLDKIIHYCELLKELKYGK